MTGRYDTASCQSQCLLTQCAKKFSDFGFVREFPMKKESESHEALKIDISQVWSTQCDGDGWSQGKS
jgi:hypothetical protein